jgi:hypothetical protein
MVGLFLNHAVEKHPSKWPLLVAKNAGTGDARPRFLGLHKQSEDHILTEQASKKRTWFLISSVHKWTISSGRSLRDGRGERFLAR